MACRFSNTEVFSIAILNGLEIACHLGHFLNQKRKKTPLSCLYFSSFRIISHFDENNKNSSEIRFKRKQQKRKPFLDNYKNGLFWRLFSKKIIASE